MLERVHSFSTTQSSLGPNELHEYATQINQYRHSGIQSRNASDSRTFVERWTAGTLVLVSDSFSIQTGKELSKDCALCWLGSPKNGTILALC